jgi:glycosyltransferase involved in cell wall biosynthesis
MRVSLISEGAYPHSFGGVSVWCDQLVRRSTTVDFTLVSLVATGAEQPVWQLPENVSGLVTIPLWGPAAPRRARLSRSARAEFRPLLQDLLRCLLAEREPTAERRFGQVLRLLFDFAQRDDLSAALGSEDALTVLTGAWSEPSSRAGTPVTTLSDAGTALALLDHALRPLAHPPADTEVVHCVANGLAVLPALAAQWTHGSALLLTEHGVYLRERYLEHLRSPYRWPVKALHLAFLRLLCAHAYRQAALIAPGNVYNRSWEQRLGADPGIIRTIYNGVDPAQFAQVESEPAVPTISWAGRIDPIKDLHTLIRAFAAVRQVRPEVRLRLFGSAPAGAEGYLQSCRDLAGELGLADAVGFEGRVEEIRDAYAAGSVVVLSSISEGFPYTLIEAMTCGRACVATDVGGVSEALGDTGRLVPPRDPEAMAAACLELLDDAELRGRLGAEARERALANFTVDRAIGTFGEVYEGLTRGRPRSVPPREPVAVPRPRAPGRPVPVFRELVRT